MPCQQSELIQAPVISVGYLPPVLCYRKLYFIFRESLSQELPAEDWLQSVYARGKCTQNKPGIMSTV